MRIKNKHVYASPARIQEVAEETKWIGRHDYRILEDDHLVIYALPLKTKKPSKKQKADEIIELSEDAIKERRARDQRKRKTERRI